MPGIAWSLHQRREFSTSCVVEYTLLSANAGDDFLSVPEPIGLVGEPCPREFQPEPAECNLCRASTATSHSGRRASTRCTEAANRSRAAVLSAQRTRRVAMLP